MMTLTGNQKAAYSKIESEIKVLADNKCVSPKEANHLMSFLACAVVDFDSPERAIAKELLCFRVLECLRTLGLKELRPFDCFQNYEEKHENKRKHGAYRKPFPLDSEFSIELTGSKNEEYPIRIILTYTKNFSEWYNAVCLEHLIDFTIGHMSLRKIPSIEWILHRVTGAYTVACLVLRQYRDQALALSQAKPRKHFRNWIKTARQYEADQEIKEVRKHNKHYAAVTMINL
jgi:hypothetical protein